MQLLRGYNNVTYTNRGSLADPGVDFKARINDEHVVRVDLVAVDLSTGLERFDRIKRLQGVPCPQRSW
jgi:hypothetical protein